MKTQLNLIFVILAVCLVSMQTVALTIKRFETTPKPTTTTTTTLPTTRVLSKNPGETYGPIVVLQHHGTLDGPSGRFQKTIFQAAPPVDLSLPPVFLPEFIPIMEDTMEELTAAASYNRPQYVRTKNFAARPQWPKTKNWAAPPVDLSRPPVFLPEATPIHEPSQEGYVARRQALLFVRG